MSVFTRNRSRREAEEPKDSALSALFDFQRFAEEPELSMLIQETEQRFGSVQSAQALSDEDMAEVSAAGALSYKKPPKRFEE